MTLGAEMRERLWRHVEQRSGPPQKAISTKGEAKVTQWLGPGLVGRVRYLRGEKVLRHATLRDWREHEG